MFPCVPGSTGEFPVEIRISGEQLVQITNTGSKSCSLEETAYTGLFWFNRHETKRNCTEKIRRAHLGQKQILPERREVVKISTCWWETEETWWTQHVSKGSISKYFSGALQLC